MAIINVKGNKIIYLEKLYMYTHVYISMGKNWEAAYQRDDTSGIVTGFSLSVLFAVVENLVLLLH